MKTVAVAFVTLALLAAPASAQMGGKHKRGDDTKTEQKPKYDEKAYQAALKSIPDSKKKYDPWGNMR